MSLSCAACHVGRVLVSGKMRYLPGMPNTEIEAQYYSKLLMLTAGALVESGFDPASTTPVNPANIKPRTSAVKALYTEMIDKARHRPESLYGSSPADIARGKQQTLAVADAFPSVIQDLIAIGVKTHFIYHVVAKNNAYKQRLPDVFEDRPGQMDAFGIASGLVAIHTRRRDNSFMEFVQRDNPKSPFFTGFSIANGLPADVAGMTGPAADARMASDRTLANLSAWAPPVPAPIDIKSVTWATHRYHANWDGNQGASSRTLASGASATGDPRMVNVRIHEPLNPFIDNLPPPPYPFASVDLARAREGKAIFKDTCATCHTPRNERIYPLKTLGVDPNRTMVNTSVSRYGLAALVMEACVIYGMNHKGEPGAEWCVPKGDWNARLDEYFRDTPRRVAEGTNGYKADMLHGIWAQAPYLHNGSVPTLGQLLCPATRPARFLRGNLHYDEALVGFEWADRPKARYAPGESMLVKEFDTTVPGRSNTGHRFGADLCPDTTGLDPIADRKEIETRITALTRRRAARLPQDAVRRRLVRWRRPGGQPQPSHAPGSVVPVLERHVPAVRIGNLAAQRQPDAGAPGLGREERHEHVGARGDAAPPIEDADFHVARALDAPLHLRESAGFLRRVEGVAHEVDEQLLELIGIGADDHVRAADHRQQRRRLQRRDPLDHGTDGHVLDGRRRQFRERRVTAQEPVQGLGPRLDDTKPTPHVVARARRPSARVRRTGPGCWQST